MAFEAYSVAVKLSLINHVSAGMALISKGLSATGGDVDKLNAKLASIGKQGAIGAAMFGGGLGLASMFKGPLNEVIKYQKEMAKLQQQGLGQFQIAEAMKFSEANKIIGTSLMDRTKIFTDAQGAFRESGKSGVEALAAAKVISPVLAQYQVATGMLADGKQGMAHAQFMQMSKTMELMGGLNDANKATQIADGIFKTVQSSGKMVSERDLRLFMSHGGVAVAGLTQKTIFAGLEPIIGELGGSTVATGLMTGYSRTHGMMALTPSIMANEALRLGVWEKDKVTRTKGGGARFLHGSPMNAELAHLQDTDTIKFAQAMMGVYAKNHITSLSDMGRENNILFGRTGGSIYTRVMQQMPVLLHSLDAYDKAQGISQTIEANKGSPMMKTLELSKAMDDLSLSIGQNVMPVFLPMLTKLTELSQELGRHPVLIKDFTYALMGLAAFLITGGLINMVIAAGRGFWLLAKALIFVGTGGLAPIIPWIARMATYLVMGATGFARFLLVAGRFLLLNPIGLVITAIAAVAFLLWNNWKEISGALKLIWSDMKTGFIQLFHGDIGGAFKSFALVFLTGWQTIFNTLIAGANTILPTSWQISKTTFADEYRKTVPGAAQFVAPVPAKDYSKDPIIVQMNMDGKRVAEVVVDHMTKSATKPRTGTQGFDPSRSMLMPGTPSTVLPRG